MKGSELEKDRNLHMLLGVLFKRIMISIAALRSRSIDCDFYFAGLSCGVVCT